MIKYETASLIKGINFCVKVTKILLVIGIIAFITGIIVGLFSIDTRKVLMAVSTFVFLALALSGTSTLKLSSSLPEGEYRDMTRDCRGDGSHGPVSGWESFSPWLQPVILCELRAPEKKPATQGNLSQLRFPLRIGPSLPGGLPQASGEGLRLGRTLWTWNKETHRIVY